MKQQLLILSTLVVTSLSAQNEFLHLPGGTSGISTTTNNRGVAIGPEFDTPDASLHIVDKTEDGTAFIIEAQNDEIDPVGEGQGPPIIVTPDYLIKGQYKDFQLPGDPSIVFSVDLNGKVQSGFNNTNVTEQLAVINNMGIYASINRSLRFNMLGGEARMIWESPGDNFQFVNGDNSTVALQLGENGQVGINTGDFFDGHDLYVDGSIYIKDDGEEDHSLYIEGSAIGEEIFVKLKDNWPDYVFDENYELMPLSQLEFFIEENGHLPNLPKAEDVHDNGLALGETERVLTEKVEELTLYIIELKKEIDTLREELEKE